MKKKSPRKLRLGQNSQKGRIVERVAAMMHSSPGVQVETRVRLPVRGSQRKREIDVLISGQIAGHLVHIPVECKNEIKPLGSPKIDQFIGKLGDIGLPTQNAIFISTSRFTRGAKERAQQAGIRTFLLTGLDDQRLESAVEGALQSQIYLLLNVEQIRIRNEISSMDPLELGLFWAPDGSECKFVQTIIWETWLKGVPPSRIGRHEIDVKVPPRWHQKVANKRVIPKVINATVVIVGLVVSISGRLRRHSLVSGVTGSVDRFHANAEFDISNSTFPVTAVESEEDLKALLSNRPELVKVTVGRLRLPRIVCGPLYWPPSSKALEEIRKVVVRSMSQGRQPPSLGLEMVEGTALEAVFEPFVLPERGIPPFSD